MTDLRQRLDRLRRLGLRRGTAHLRQKPQEPAPQKRAVGIEEVVAGQECPTPVGSCFLAEERWPLSHRHGDLPLAAALEVPPQTLALLAGLPAGESLDLRRAVFFDIETSGLSSGAGTYVFEIGAGFFEGDTFRVQQFFMRDLTEEPAYLHAVGALLDRFEAIVSFNGRTFDLPMLNARLTLARQPRRLTRAPHLDLLTPARRLWRRRLDSCSLGSLERQVLGVTRGEQEVPGWLVPRLYFDYMQTGDASELAGVFYHNLVDVLSMVTLTARLGAIFHDPHAAGCFDALDLLSLGRWYESLGLIERGEAAYRAVQDEPSAEEAWRRLSFLLKRQERREEAVAIWRDVIRRKDPSSVYAHVELAKHYEWRVKELPAAAEVTRQAIALLSPKASDRRSQETLAELTHRLRRLERKLAR